ncbi:MAG: hypothetical protein HYT61_02075 [Candidatus Yanofskybacteria bacterium]|nr:hypothetical protein [Candidatus Yanofskybacteria bacterium]
MKKNLVYTISFLAVIASIMFVVRYSSAYSINETSLPLPSILNINPFDSDLFKNLVPNIDLGTTMPNLNLLNINNLSSNDFVSVLRAVAILAINLFLIVIQTVAGILKALLPFLT